MTVKHIVFVTDAWKPQENGAVRVTEMQVSILAKRGYRISLIEPSQFYTIPLPFYREIRLALFPRRRVARMLRELAPDAVHLVTEGPLGWAGRSVCNKQKIPYTTWYHTHFQLYADVRLNGLLRTIYALLRRFHGSAIRTMVSTNSLKNVLETDGYKNVAVVPLGVDTELFTMNPSVSVDRFKKPVFVYFGRLAIEKSPEDFLRLELPGTKVVIGGGPLFEELKNKYPNAHFLGRYTVGKAFVNQLSFCDVFVFPSRTETFGLVVLEALACGIPVAAYDVMGPRDIITNGVDGYIGDDLRDAALKCLALSSETCRATALKYSWEHSANEFIKNLAWISK